ncbi:conserved hypothetical protein [Leishmania braziliensis MHOM/BR/75/M2904]|uniref:Uncharacterized protein n=2 Tax=Leishmania braziliensis TaxID=5660 RepID=A4HLX9_LEIBR|nr:conserved hypothetical protein [Leishmania braziliensis MHOM/BR/75/M2904]CAJ2479680.1 unnamed protein product [Leishmania braziliensis]CAM40828.1 conserved hypothetical protein [Leishmania braziliensis MHOM/BR/75/M2904]
MSTYEWVIEQEGPDGVTTRVVFDFADVEAGSHGNGGRMNMSSSSYHLQNRRDGRARGMSGGALTAGGFIALKEAARSEGGSSRRSSKRSNGSRSHCQRRHHLGTSSRDGTFLGGARGNGGSSENVRGTMAGSTSSVFTSAGLRQRYQRILFGGGRGGIAAPVAGVKRVVTTTSDTTAFVLTTGPMASTRVDASAGMNGDAQSFISSSPHGATADGPLPSTLFMSAYGAEMADEDENQSSSSSCPIQRSRRSTKKGGCSGGAGVSSVGCVSAAGDLTNGTFTGYGTARHSSVQVPSATTAAPVPLSDSHHRCGETCNDSSDDDLADDTNIVKEDDSYSMLRDVWAARAACPRSLTTTRAMDFPTFPPLHPISVEEESEAMETMAESCRPLAGGPDVRDVLSGAAGAKTTYRVPFATTTSQEATPSQTRADATEDILRYNKMLLKKERQRRRGRGWQSAGPSGGPTPSLGRTFGLYVGETSRGLCDGESVSVKRHRRDERAVEPRGKFDSYRSASSSRSSDSNEDDVDYESCDTSSLSSLECLSTSSSDDFDVRELRADSVFASTVQSLASRAERERKKMEAREEQMLWSEAVQNTGALIKRRSQLHSDTIFEGLLPSANVAAVTTPASPVSLHAVPRRGDAALACGLVRNGAVSGTAYRNDSVSSFFISPIHQSVAAESAAWTAGTGFQFLGQGGLGGNSTTTSSVLPSSRPAPLQRRGSASAPGRPTVSRRRGRSDENNEGGVEDLNDPCGGGALSSAAQAVVSDAQTGTRRARKKRKRGDRAHQSVVGQCGGSRALRPVAAPSNGPPLEVLPCSRKDMREDLLEAFLMEAMLDEDDFQLC